jgi:anti-anti-sigma factor
MHINTKYDSEIYDVILSGKFTFADHTKFRNLLESIRKLSLRQIILHMAEVEFIDSAALGMLLLARDEASKSGKSLLISDVSGQVEKIFKLARFDTLFDMR